MLSNAGEAMEGIKNPTIALRVRRLKQAIRISVEDNGQGIVKSHLSEIFKPFFTTKIQGSGLGLNIVQKIVARIGGNIDIASDKGKGTRVVIDIPCGKVGIGGGIGGNTGGIIGGSMGGGEGGGQ